MSNLYEVLEVSEKASKEVIDKAYRVLAKKYHPDLQEQQNKKSAQIKMQEINDAYEILGDDEKRRQYDLALDERRQEEKRIEEERKRRENEQYYRNQSVRNNQYQQRNNYYSNNAYNNVPQNYNNVNNEYSSKDNMKEFQKEMERAYSNAYYNFLRSMGYKIKKPWTLKRFLELLKLIGILLIIFVILWLFPPTHKLLVDLYKQNWIIKTFIDILIKIFIGLWNGIVKFIKGLFIK